MDDWFVSAPGDPAADAGRRAPRSNGRRRNTRSAWTTGCATWATGTSRACRYFGLPLPFYPCECGHFNVIGSRAELEEQAVRGLDQLQELHRPWIDEVPIGCGGSRSRGRAHSRGRRRLARRRHRPLLDARLAEPGVGSGRERDGLCARADAAPTFRTMRTGSSGSPPTGSRRCASRSASGSTPSASWRSRSTGGSRTGASSPTRRSPKRHGREMHKSWGNAIEVTEALERMGADVMRWLYCDTDAEPAAALRLRDGGGGQEGAPDLLELGLVFHHVREHRRLEAGVQRAVRRSRSTAGWPRAPRSSCATRQARTSGIGRRTSTAAFAPSQTICPTGTSVARAGASGGRSRGVAALWNALTTALQVIAPVMPFLAEHLWRDLVSKDESVFLAGWPEAGDATRSSWQRSRRSERRDTRPPGARRVPAEARQPLRRLVVQGAARAASHEDEIVTSYA